MRTRIGVVGVVVLLGVLMAATVAPEAVGNILVSLSVLVFVWAVVGLIKPRWGHIPAGPKIARQVRRRPAGRETPRPGRAQLRRSRRPRGGTAAGRLAIIGGLPSSAIHSIKATSVTARMRLAASPIRSFWTGGFFFSPRSSSGQSVSAAGRYLKRMTSSPPCPPSSSAMVLSS